MPKSVLLSSLLQDVKNNEEIIRKRANVLIEIFIGVYFIYLITNVRL